MKMRINTIPTCPLCKQKRSVGAINSLIGRKVKRMYFCTNCMVEFSLKGILYPPIQEKEPARAPSKKVHKTNLSLV